MWLSNWILKLCISFFWFSPNQIGKKKYQELYYIFQIWQISLTVSAGLYYIFLSFGFVPDILSLGLRRWAWNDLIIFNTTFWRFQILGGTSSHFSTWLLSIHVATCALSFFDEFFWIIIEVQKQGKGSLLCVTAIAL